MLSVYPTERFSLDELKKAIAFSVTTGGQHIDFFFNQQWKGCKTGKMCPSARTTTAGFLLLWFAGCPSGTRVQIMCDCCPGSPYIRSGLLLFAHEILGKRKLSKKYPIPLILSWSQDFLAIQTDVGCSLLIPSVVIHHVPGRPRVPW